MLIALNKDGIQVKVLAWAIARNGWEYYITEMPDEDGIFYAYVQGFESEFGTVSMAEIQPHIVVLKTASEISTDPRSDAHLLPPEGGRWLTDAEIAELESQQATPA